MPESYCVAVVDDDEAVRFSTGLLLKRAGHEVILFASGDAFLAGELPEELRCVLLDMRMPGMDGLAVMRALQERRQRPAIVVLTGHGDIPLAVEAMRLGAFDFLEKPYSPDILLDAIARASAAPVVESDKPEIDREAEARVGALSERQRAVLLGILRGRPNKIIAYELGLSIRTVEAYRAQMLTKLGVRGTAEAVRMAISAGLGAA